MQELGLSAEVDESNKGRWRILDLFSSDGLQLAVLISTLVQLALGALLYMDDDFTAVGFLCVPTIVVLPVTMYFHLNQMDGRRYKRTPKPNKRQIEAPPGGDTLKPKEP